MLYSFNYFRIIVSSVLQPPLVLTIAAMIVLHIDVVLDAVLGVLQCEGGCDQLGPALQELCELVGA